MGCCFNAWLWLRDRYGDWQSAVVSSTRIMRFVNTTCAVSVPRGCPRTTRRARIILRLRNIAYQWVVANALKFWEAIRADIASHCGAAIDDVQSTNAEVSAEITAAVGAGAANTQSQTHQFGFTSLFGLSNAVAVARGSASASTPAPAPAPKTFRAMRSGQALTVHNAAGTVHTISVAPYYSRNANARFGAKDASADGSAAAAGTSVDVSVGSDSDGSIFAIQAIANAGIASGSFDLTLTNTLPTEAYVTPGEGAGMEMTSDSDDSSAAGATAPGTAAVPVTLLTTVAAAILFAAF